jgi:hypothetical protein
MEMATRRREQEVWQVLDDLWAMHGDAKNLTGEAIRERLVFLGKSRGSPNEIYKYKKTWVKSRGVVTESNYAQEPMVSDPISRAVHLVHEKLQEETLEQIKELKDQYEQQAAQKDEQIDIIKQSLNKVVLEFGELECDLKRVQHEKLEVQEQLFAEVELRKAGERELALIKTRYEQELKAHEVLIREIKVIHEQHLASLTAEKQHDKQLAEQQIEALIDDKKQLGHQFSEQLNELKMELYNKDIVTKNLSNKVAEFSSQVEGLLARIQSQQQILDALQQEKINMVMALKEEAFRLTMMREEQQLTAVAMKGLNVALKKAEITVARLRIQNAHR